FTDAVEARQEFENLVTAPDLDRNLLLIYGPPFIGKTSVLKMSRLFCRRKGIPVGWFDAATPGRTNPLHTPPEVQFPQSWAEDLRENGLRLGRYQKEVDLYIDLLRKVERLAAKDPRSRGLDTLAEIGKAALAGVPHIAPVLTAASGPMAEVAKSIL